MQTVTHKIYGVGEVINKETTENGSYITVNFEIGNGRSKSETEATHNDRKN